MDNIISIILLLGSIQGFLLAIFIFFKKKNIRANKFLFISILFLSFSLFANFVELKEWHLSYPNLIGIQHLFVFIFMPALYFYIIFTTQKSNSLKKQHIFHILPALIYMIFHIPLFLQSADIKLMNALDYSSIIYSNIHEATLNIYPLIYCILMLMILIKYSERIKKVYSNIEKNKLKWLKFLSYSVFIAVLISIFEFVFSILVSGLPVFITFSTAIIIVCLIYAIGYFAIQQPEIFNKELCKIEKEIISEINNKKINDSNFEVYYDKLLKNLEQNKTYTNPKLTIKDLSKELTVPVYILSKVINEKSGLNFLTFINQFRIKEVEMALLRPENQKEQIMVLAYAAGFNSKSTFNYCFKKNTGTTPTQFRKQSAINS